jgi:hypothetical protein
MELWRIAIPVEDAADRRQLFALLRELHVPMDPCSGDPHFRTGAGGRQQLLVVVDARMQEGLRKGGRMFEIVRDFRDLPDPIRHVSPKNRYAEPLARLRASKGRR